MTANQFHRAPVVYILCITFLLLLTAGFTYPSEEENPDFKIFKVTMEGTTKKVSSKPIKDFYVNAGSEDGLSNSMILVYTEKNRSWTKLQAEILIFLSTWGK